MSAQCSHPPYNDLVITAVKSLQGRQGVSRQKILKHIRSNYEMKHGFESLVKQALKRCVNKNILVQVKGTGASGSFKVNKEIKNISKVLSPRNTGTPSTEMIPAKRKPVPRSSLTDKENVCSTGSRRGSRIASKNAMALIKNITTTEAEVCQTGGLRKRVVLKAMMGEDQAGSEYEGREENSSDEEEEEQTQKKKGRSRSGSKDESMDTANDKGEEEEGLCEYEKQRLKKIKENRAFLASLDLGAAKEELKEVTKKQVKKRTVSKPNPEDLEPSRRSLRIQRIQPNGEPMQPPPPPVAESSRLPDISLPMECICGDHSKHSLPEEVFRGELVNSCRTADHFKDKNEMQSVPASARIHSFHDLKLSHLQKVTPKRTTAFAFHSASSKSLVVAGDAQGILALWDISIGSSGIYMYQPHIRTITDLAMPSSQSTSNCHLLSTSTDGTLRSTDFEKGVLDLLYCTPESGNIGLYCCDISLQGDRVFTGQSNGMIVLLDLRMRNTPVKSIQAHERMVKSVHINPVHDHLMLSASSDTFVKLWDIRNLSYQLCCLPFSRPVCSAYFSPIHGSKILVTAMNECISMYHAVFSQGNKLSGLLPGKKIYHRNQNGYLQLHAKWDPTSDDCFIVGSLDFPRQVEIHSTGDYAIGFRDEQLTSVCPLNAIHPSQQMIGSVNTAGVVHLWM